MPHAQSDTVFKKISALLLIKSMVSEAGLSFLRFIWFPLLQQIFIRHRASNFGWQSLYKCKRLDWFGHRHPVFWISYRNLSFVSSLEIWFPVTCKVYFKSVLCSKSTIRFLIERMFNLAELLDTSDTKTFPQKECRIWILLEVVCFFFWKDF